MLHAAIAPDSLSATRPGANRYRSQTYRGELRSASRQETGSGCRQSASGLNKNPGPRQSRRRGIQACPLADPSSRLTREGQTRSVAGRSTDLRVILPLRLPILAPHENSGLCSGRRRLQWRVRGRFSRPSLLVPILSGTPATPRKVRHVLPLVKPFFSEICKKFSLIQTQPKNTSIATGKPLGHFNTLDNLGYQEPPRLKTYNILVVPDTDKNNIIYGVFHFP